MFEENNNGIRNCMDEAIIKMVGKITLAFSEYEDMEKQRQLKAVLEESLYGYEIISQSKELLVSDLDEKITLYLGVRKLEGIALSTINNYRRILHKFSDCFQTKTISMINTMDIRYFLMAYKQRKVKDSTVNGIIFCLKKFLSWLFENEIILKDPCKQVKEIKTEQRLKQVATDEEIEMLRDNCITLKEKCLLNFALDTGCRVSEISDLNINDINFQNLSCTVIGKGNKQRFVYFTVKTKRLLQKYTSERKEIEEHSAVFLSDKFPFQRIHSRAMQLMLSKIKHRANLDDKEYITMHG